MAEEWPAPISAAVLVARPPTVPSELISGVLFRGGTMMFSGPSKSRKTYTALELGVAVASGGEWQGFLTNSTPVLYLNLELQGHAIAKRLKEITEARGMNGGPSDLYLLNLRGYMVGIDDLRERLEPLIRDKQAGLVIIDPHYKISAASGAEENSNDQQGRLLYEIERICNRLGAAVVLAHHFAKGNAASKNAIDRGSGGGVMARWGDVVMTFTEHKEPECMTVEMALRNFKPVDPFVMRWTHPRWHREPNLLAAELRVAGRSDRHPASAALAALGGGALSLKGWAARLKWSESTLRRKVGELLDGGVIQLEEGCYSKAS